jgi:hypothetical protein
MEFQEALLETPLHAQGDAAQYVAPDQSYRISVCILDDRQRQWDADDGGQGEPFVADVSHGPTIRAMTTEELVEKLAGAGYPVTLVSGWEPYSQAPDDFLQRLVEREVAMRDVQLAQCIMDRIDIVLRRFVAAEAPTALVQQVDETAYALVEALEADGVVSRSTLRAAAQAQEQALAWMRERGLEDRASDA